MGFAHSGAIHPRNVVRLNPRRLLDQSRRANSERMWPDTYPAGCPPDSADETSGVVYRYVATASPASSDFVPLAELEPDRNFGSRRCQAVGLSVLRGLGDARARRIPAFRNHRIASIILHATDGRIKATPTRRQPTHCTWWVPSDVRNELHERCVLVEG